MKLIHRNEAKKTPAHKMQIECGSGTEMSGIMHKMQRWCTETPSDSVVVWDSGHYTITLWFEEGKYKTWFELKGLG
jgi:hypothetical protein